MRGLIAAAVVALLVIGAVEVAYRLCGGMPEVVPGMTRIEYDWKLTHMGSAPLTVVVGDSRVGWGFSEKAYAEETRNSTTLLKQGFNLGAAGHSTERLIGHLMAARPDCQGCMLVINFSPAAFYVFGSSFFPVEAERVQVTLQDRIDDEIRAAVGEYVFTFSQHWSVIMSTFSDAVRRPAAQRVPNITWVHRTAFADGFYNAELASSDNKPIDREAYQLEYYRSVLVRLRSLPGPDARHLALREKIAQAITRGWKVVLVRLPIGPAMRQLEDELLDPRYGMAAFARDADVQFVDYDEVPETRDLPTLDGSHLTPASARLVSARIARDLAR